MLQTCTRFLSNQARKMRCDRGALIVFEGGDRCGKTTQCKKLVEALNKDGIKTEMLNFPNRKTAIGKVINDYLERKCELEDHAVHLLFAANRWELTPYIEKSLAEGTTLIVDRYSYSGVAFSAAKPNLSLSWCQEPEKGLIKPDALIYFTLSPEEAAKRSEFGGERYETTQFQAEVAYNYTLLEEEDWKTIDASKSIDDLHLEVKAIVTKVIAEVKDTATATLWVDSDKVTMATSDKITMATGDKVTMATSDKVTMATSDKVTMATTNEKDEKEGVTLSDEPGVKKPKLNGVEST